MPQASALPAQNVISSRRVTPSVLMSGPRDLPFAPAILRSIVWSDRRLGDAVPSESNAPQESYQDSISLYEPIISCYNLLCLAMIPNPTTLICCSDSPDPNWRWLEPNLTDLGIQFEFVTVIQNSRLARFANLAHLWGALAAVWRARALNADVIVRTVLV